MIRVRGRRLKLLQQWIVQHKKAILIGIPAAIIGTLLIVQLAYPGSRLLPLQKIDGQAFGFTQKSEVSNSLNKAYASTQLALHFGEAKKPHYTPTLREIGLKVDNERRVEELNYPWYLRLVPTSIVWAHAIKQPTAPTYVRDSATLSKYLAEELDGICSVAPQNATAKVANDKIVVVPEEDGGVCDESDVRETLSSVTPLLPDAPSVRVAMDPRPASLRSDDVTPIVETMNQQIEKGVSLRHGDISVTVDPSRLLSWLSFHSDNDEFSVRINGERSDEYIRETFEEKVARPAGVTKIATKDFVETSREEGAPGRQLDLEATRSRVVEYLLADNNMIEIAEAEVAPRVQYSRSYSNSDTGLSALMRHYAETHPGTYGMSLIELDGQRRRAHFNESTKFTTASTYKLYVAYSALKRVESGELRWSDQIAGGRNLEQCFDDMIVKSDNPCAEALVAKIGYRPLTVDAQSIVSANTTFLDTQSYKTTAGDLSTFMASLATGQIALSTEHQTRFLDALRRNQFRQGIPAGASGAVADKVGFLEGFLHDAAIVYGPSGTYALSIMTDGSSWENIAELTREIEKLRG